MTHTQRYHAHNKTTGYGHVYQGRYKSFPVGDDDHFHTVCRYVERNALTANVVDRAEDYRWGSLWNWDGGDSVIELSPWPVKRLPRWIERVNQALTNKELKLPDFTLPKCDFASPRKHKAQAWHLITSKIRFWSVNVSGDQVSTFAEMLFFQLLEG